MIVIVNASHHYGETTIAIIGIFQKKQNYFAEGKTGMPDKNVMVVEDNEKNRKLVRVVLKSKGYNVIEATTGEEALNILKNQKPNIILMDIQLPGIDGLTLIKQIKADAATKEIPIIAVTAYAMKGDEQKILDTGCEAYMSKPINTQELPLTIEKYIK